MKEKAINTDKSSEELVSKGLSFYDAHDYGPAFDCFSKAAEAGDTKAQYHLGLMHYNGEGVKQDYAQAFSWYQMAAEAGNADAQVNLGYMYDNGDGVTRDCSQALSWYLKAAEAEHVVAQYNLGVMYDNGVQDQAQALSWYRKAAEGGYAQAQNLLGSMYEHGRGVKRNLTQAVEWYRNAAVAGNAKAQFNYGRMYFFGVVTTRNYAKAFHWYQKAAKAGDVDAQASLGWMYLNGRYVKRDYAQALSWYRKAAEAGHTQAQKALELLQEKQSNKIVSHVHEHGKVTAITLIDILFQLLAKTGGKIDTWESEDAMSDQYMATRVKKVDILSNVFMGDVFTDCSVVSKANAILNGEFFRKRKMKDYAYLVKMSHEVIKSYGYGRNRSNRDSFSLRDLEMNYRTLFRYKKLVYQLKTLHSGILEAPYSYLLPYYLTEEVNSKIDLRDIDYFISWSIDPWNRSFSHEELVDKWNYPVESPDSDWW